MGNFSKAEVGAILIPAQEVFGCESGGCELSGQASASEIRSRQCVDGIKALVDGTSILSTPPSAPVFADPRVPPHLRERAERLALEARLASLESRLHPHF